MDELDRNKRIKEEFSRINGFFEKLNENEKSIILPLIQNASFMRVTLEDLQQIIAEQGPVEAYQNGANQYGMKQSAALQSYNALVKNYASVIKNLFSLLPPMEKPNSNHFVVIKTEEEKEAERLECINRSLAVEQKIKRAAEWQKKVREYDAKIAKAESQEERKKLIQERNSLKME